MDAIRFDAFVRSLRSRRGALRTFVGMGAALGLPRAARAVEATCDPNGAACDPTTPDTCCTGTCKKHKRKHTCAPAGAAYGCTSRRNSCRHGVPNPCPDNPNGTFCLGGKKSKPLCAITSGCQACQSDDDCTENFGPKARCIKGCHFCNQIGLSTTCAEAAPPPV